MDTSASVGSPIDDGSLFIAVLYAFSSVGLLSIFGITRSDRESIILQALNPVAIVILVNTANTHEHSSRLSDASSLQVQSIEVAERTRESYSMICLISMIDAYIFESTTSRDLLRCNF